MQGRKPTGAQRAARNKDLHEGICIDGDFKEGGGQILRYASALGAITQQRVCVENIRAKRPKPGLRPQHLTGLQIMRDVSNGKLLNGRVGATTVNLKPGLLRVGEYMGDCKTAGSCTLLVQSILPCLLFASPDEDGHEVSTVELRGGTDVQMAPPIDYLRYVLIPTLQKNFGIDAEVELIRRGFYPVGGGIAKLRVRCLSKGQSLPAIDLTDPDTISCMRVHGFAAGKFAIGHGEKNVVEDAVNDLKALFGLNIEKKLEIEAVRETDQTAVESGAGCCIVAESTTGQLYGATGITEDTTGRKTKGKGPPNASSNIAAGSQAAYSIHSFIDKHTGVDDWMQDQLILFMALANGISRIRVSGPTLHTETAIEVAEQLTKAKFSLKKDQQNKDLPETCIIECEGIGLTRN